jgi:hypothetical protein
MRGKNRIPHQVDGENHWRGQIMSGAVARLADMM